MNFIFKVNRGYSSVAKDLWWMKWDIFIWILKAFFHIKFLITSL